MDQDMVSFVIRFVRESGESQQARWRGIIRHVQSNSEASFTEFSEALAFMQGFVNDVAQAGSAEVKGSGVEQGEANPFLETAQLWSGFMPRYTKMMMDAMGDAVGGTEEWDLTKPMEQAMSRTLAMWGIPSSGQTQSRTGEERTADSMEALTRQLAEMTAKLADLEKQIAKLRAESKKDRG